MNLTVSYNDQSGNPQTTTFPFQVSPVAGQMQAVPLAAGSTGVRSITSVQLSGTTGTAGNFGLTILRRLGEIACLTAASGDNLDAFALGLPTIYTSACLFVFCLAGATSTGDIKGGIAIAQGQYPSLMSIRQLPGQKPKRTRHRVSIAIGAVIKPLSENFVFPGAPVSTSGEADGASALTGGALRVVLPAGTAAGTGAIAGAAIRLENVSNVLTGTSDIAGQADCIAWATGTLDGAGSLDGAASALIFPGTRPLPGQKPQRTRHRVSIAIGPVIDSLSEQFVFPKTNAVTALGEADGESRVTAAAMLLTVATGAMDGASAAEGDGIRVALPAGALAGNSATTGAAIRRAVASGALAGAGDAAGLANRIVWATGTLAGAGSTLVGIPTMRIFAPAWGNSSLTGDARASLPGRGSDGQPSPRGGPRRLHPPGGRGNARGRVRGFRDPGRESQDGRGSLHCGIEPFRQCRLASGLRRRGRWCRRSAGRH